MTPPYCDWPWRALWISGSGRIRVCPGTGLDLTDVWTAGGVKHVWNSEPMQRLRQRLLVGEPLHMCKLCNAPLHIQDYLLQLPASVVDSNFAVDHPKEIVIDLTTKCLCRCYMCYRRTYTYPLVDMEIGFFQEIAKNYFPKCQSLILTAWNGEFLLHDNLGGILDIVLQYHIPHVFGFTSGLCFKDLSKEIFEKLLKTYKEIFISIDSVRQKEYERIREGSSWTRLLENLDYLRNSTLSYHSPLKVSLTVVLMKKNIQQLPEIVKFAAAHGFSKIQGEHICIVNSKSEKEYLGNSRKGRRLYNRFSEESKEIAEEMGLDFFFPPPFDGPTPRLLDLLNTSTGPMSWLKRASTKIILPWNGIEKFLDKDAYCLRESQEKEHYCPVKKDGHLNLY